MALLAPAKMHGTLGYVPTSTARSSGNTRRAASTTPLDRNMSTTTATAVLSICHATNSMKRNRLRTSGNRVIMSHVLIVATMIRCPSTLQPSQPRNHAHAERHMLHTVRSQPSGNTSSAEHFSKVATEGYRVRRAKSWHPCRLLLQELGPH